MKTTKVLQTEIETLNIENNENDFQQSMVDDEEAAALLKSRRVTMMDLDGLFESNNANPDKMNVVATNEKNQKYERENIEKEEEKMNEIVQQRAVHTDGTSNVPHKSRLLNDNNINDNKDIDVDDASDRHVVTLIDKKVDKILINDNNGNDSNHDENNVDENDNSNSIEIIDDNNDRDRKLSKLIDDKAYDEGLVDSLLAHNASADDILAAILRGYI